MTHITVSSETRLTGANGDGPAALENAATLYAVLSALGAVPIVEIVIRTQTEVAATPARVVEHAAESGEDRTTLGGPPFSAGEPTPVPFAPAAPAPLPDEPPVSWRKMKPGERKQAALRVLRTLHATLDRAPLQAEYAAEKPDWMPGAAALTNLFRMSWDELTAHAAASAAGA